MIVARHPCEKRKREILTLLEGQDVTKDCLHELTLFVLIRDRVAATGTCFRVPGPILMMDFIAIDEGFRPIAGEFLNLLLEEARQIRDRNGYRVIYLTSPDPSLTGLIGGDVWRGETKQAFFGGPLTTFQEEGGGSHD